MTEIKSRANFKDGDIYRWRYKVETGHGTYQYHCKSCIGVVRNGRLFDTYWHGNDNANWTADSADRDLHLTFVANFAELEKSYEGMAERYADEDCVNLNHSNSSRDNFYIRKGAALSRDKIRSTALVKLQKAEREIAWQSEKAENLRTSIQAIDAGADLSEVCL